MNIIKTICNYYSDDETIIFSNWVDALLSLGPLIVLPFLSIINIFKGDNSFWQYGFAILSISLCGICDSIARFENKGRTLIPKLVVRIIFDFLALIMSCIFSGNSVDLWVLFIAPCLLIISGIVVAADAVKQIIVSIRMSKWAV